MARFVVYLGFKPGDYWSLTLDERDAITRCWNEAHRRKR
jgi:hypothetical protein